MLPDFLGIGVRRGGSTWLWELLHSHPDAYVPPHHREVHFFSRDELYAEGLASYERFFPDRDEAHRYAAVGEVSPGYLSTPEAAERIRAVPSITRLIAILRSPIERTISHYNWRIRIDDYQGDVLEFVRDYPNALRWSTYAEDIARYQSLFSADELLVMIFEDAFADITAARARIASHLALDPSRFPEGAGEQPVNTGGVPKRTRLYRLMHATARRMRRRGMHRAIDDLGRGLGLKSLAEGGGATKIQIPPEHRARLYEHFRDDIARLEDTLGRPLDHWKPENA